MRSNLVPRNVVEAMTPPKARRAEMKAWTPEQARSFPSTLSGDRWEALFRLALSCGLRTGELLGPRWEDVDLESGRLQFRRTIQRIGKGRGLTVGEPKTAKGRRQIVVPRAVVEWLRRWRTQQKEERLLAGPRWQDTGYLFASHLGTPSEPRRLKADFAAKLEAAMSPRIRLHDMRHTCATVLLTQGVHPKVVHEMLGHSQIGLTMDTYSHGLPTMQEDVGRIMDRMLA